MRIGSAECRLLCGGVRSRASGSGGSAPRGPPCWPYCCCCFLIRGGVEQGNIGSGGACPCIKQPGRPRVVVPSSKSVVVDSGMTNRIPTKVTSGARIVWNLRDARTDDA